MAGIVSYGVYLPYWRLQRAAIAQALGSGKGAGTRRVASYDEDTTSMGVEAARVALRQAPEGAAPADVVFATTAPAYADKTNATAIHAALALPSHVGAYDIVGAVRSNVAACTFADRTGGLAVLADIRAGLPGGADEAGGGDAAVALLFGDGPAALTETIGGASATGEFLDRWRLPGEPSSRQWEERFGEHAYAPLVEEAVTAALKAAGIGAGDIDHAIVTGLHQRAVNAARRSCRVPAGGDRRRPRRVRRQHGRGPRRADARRRARPRRARSDDRRGPARRRRRRVDPADDRRAGRVPAGVDGPRAGWRPGATTCRTPSSSRGAGSSRASHRAGPSPMPPAAPPSLRTEQWKYGFIGSRDETGFVHLPPARVSMGTGAVDQMEPVRMADVPATIATFTVDRLAYSMSPPVVAAVIDFDGGGRFQCELTDVDPSTVAIGDRVEMTFRRLFTSGGVHNYFWKARPLARTGEED